MFQLAFLQNQNPADFFDTNTLTIVIVAVVVFILLVTLVPMFLVFRRHQAESEVAGNRRTGTGEDFTEMRHGRDARR